MWPQTKLILTSAVLAAMIWWFADQADRTEATIAVQARLLTDPDGEVVARFDGPTHLRLNVSVRGTNKAIRSLVASGSGGVVEIDWVVPPDAPLGQTTQETYSVMKAAPRFNGVTILSVHPRRATIIVDHYVTHELPLRIAEGASVFSGEPRLDPPAARVRILESNWARVPVDARRISLNLDDYLSGQPQGRLLNFDVAPPVLLAGQPITVEPETINVKLTLRERSAQRTIAPVVVKFAVAGDLWGNYLPELKDPSVQRLEITVVGPDEALDRISAKDILGIIDVTSDDVSPDREYRLKRPVFILPPGIRLKEEPPLVEFRLRPAH